MIDTTEPGSPGWWAARLSNKMRAEHKRLERLRRYYEGDPPLPEGAEGQKRAYAAFQRKARLNLAELACEAVRDRMTPVGLRTAVANDRVGDQDAWKTWRKLGMDLVVADALEHMLGGGRGCLVIGRDDTEDEDGNVQTGEVIVTQEDARFLTYETDPARPARVRAALRMVHDPLLGAQLAYLYLPGRVRVARSNRISLTKNGAQPYVGGEGWDWDEDLSGDLPEGFENDVPIFPMPNRHGLAEFERHTDILDRINHMILQRMMIVTVQAFKQRALKGDLPEFYPEGHPQAGQKIDYDGIFVADPGALWMLPATAEIWESGQTDITPILGAVKDDVLHYAAVTRTPLAMLNPDSANQTAEGATFAREGLVYRGEDRIMRASEGLRQALSFIFRLLGDEQRAALEDIEILWAPLERRSLAERADASSKAVADMPRHARLTHIWDLPPALAKQYDDEMTAAAAEAAEQDPAVRAARGLALPGLDAF